MCAVLKFPLDTELLFRLPRHPDWRYERVNGEACLSPRPRPLLLVRPTGVAVRAVAPAGTEIRMIDDRHDSAGIVELLIDVWAAEDPYRSASDPEATLRAEIERSLNAPGLGVLAADARGVCAVVIVPSAKSQAPTLTWLTVRRDARERGLATGLLGVVVQALSASGVRELASATSAANVPSLRWHLSRGFRLAEDPLREALRNDRS